MGFGANFFQKTALCTDTTLDLRFVGWEKGERAVFEGKGEGVTRLRRKEAIDIAGE